MSERIPFSGLDAVREHRRTVRIVESTSSRRFMGHVMDAMVKRDSSHQTKSNYPYTPQSNSQSVIPAAHERIDIPPVIPSAEEIARRRAQIAAQELSNSN